MTGSLSQSEQLLAALQAGNENAFATLVDQWSPAMLHMAQRYVGNEHTAQDVVQEAWLIVIQSLPHFQDRSTLRTWVLGIVVNCSHSAARADRRAEPASDALAQESSCDVPPSVNPRRFRSREDKFPGGWTLVGAPRPWVPSPENAVVARELRSIVSDAIRRLPDAQQVVVTLRDVDGLSSREVCDALAITPANQRVLLHRARSTVRARVEDFYEGGA